MSDVEFVDRGQAVRRQRYFLGSQGFVLIFLSTIGRWRTLLDICITSQLWCSRHSFDLHFYVVVKLYCDFDSE